MEQFFKGQVNKNLAMHKNHTCIVFYVVGKMYIYVFTFRVQILSIYCKIRQ